MRSPSLSMLTVALLLGASACDATGPRSVVDVYALESVDGAPLPYVLPGSAGSKVVAETYTLYDDGSYTRETTTEEGGHQTTHPGNGRYRTQGTSIFFEIPPIAPGAGFPDVEGTLNGDAMTIGKGWFPNHTIWVYRRVP